MEFEIDGFKIAIRSLEDGKDYALYTLFIEMPETQHHGFLMKKGDKILAKGEIARYIRDQRIEGLEMAAAPPADTNAVIVFRIDKKYDIVERVAKDVVKFLKSRGFL